MYRVLLVGDDAGRLDAARKMLAAYEKAPFGFDVRCATGLATAGDHLGDGEVDVVLADLTAPSLARLDAVCELLEQAGDVPVVVLAADGDAGSALAAVSRGAQDVLVAGRFDSRSLADALRFAVERKHRLNSCLRQSREYRSNLRAVVSQSAETVLVVDGDGVIRFASPAAADLFGLGVQELLGLPFAYPLQPGQADEIDLPRDDDTIATATMRTAAVTWHGAEAFLVTLTDVTSLRKKDRRLRQAINMEAIGRLTAGVAHNFNNKLTVITGFARLVLAQLDDGHPLKDNIQEIARAAGQSAKLVNQLLSFGRKQLRPQTVSLIGLLESMKPSLKRLIGPDIQVTYDLPDDLGGVRVDPTQMEEAVVNLVTNARDAMPAGGELRIAASNVDLPASYASQNLDASAGPHIVLTVSDTGTGMDEQTLEQVFQPFFTTKPAGKGTGIGLAMVYAFTVQSGGHVVVDSKPDEGTTFAVYLPRMRAEADQMSQTDFTADFGTKGSGTILVAEDEQQVRSLLCRVLTACGYAVIEAADGCEALRKSQDHDGKIDMLITDIVMPGMNGRMLAQNLARTRPETKLLYISGYTGGVVNRDEIAAEGAKLLAKPFSPDALLAVVGQQLAQANV